MKYEVTHEGALEIHKVEIHQVNLAAAAHRINRELYSQSRLSTRMSDHVLALALIVRAVEDEEAGIPTQTDETTTPIPFPNNGTSE
jgi:hypothetical protein